MWKTFSSGPSTRRPFRWLSFLRRIRSRLFGRRLVPGFHSFRTPGDAVGMMDQQTYDFLHSTAPTPTRASLRGMVEGITRVRLIDAGMAEGRALPGPVLLEVGDPKELEQLKVLMDIDETGPFHHCMCLGGPTFELQAGGKLRSVVGLQHGRAIRWDGWRGDAPLANPVGLREWMARLGAPGSLPESERDRASGREEPDPSLLRKLTVSKELAEVIGRGPLSRVDVVKKLWAYIRRNNLQDANERRTINADDKLKPVFAGKDRVSVFEMTKLVNAHLCELDPSEPEKPHDG